MNFSNITHFKIITRLTDMLASGNDTYTNNVKLYTFEKYQLILKGDS